MFAADGSPAQRELGKCSQRELTDKFAKGVDGQVFAKGADGQVFAKGADGQVFHKGS